jgi:hypothetical protein
MSGLVHKPFFAKCTRHSLVAWIVQQAKNEKLTAEVVELKQKIEGKEQHHHHHKKCKRPETPWAVKPNEDPVMQEPLEKKAKADEMVHAH